MSYVEIKDLLLKIKDTYIDDVKRPYKNSEPISNDEFKIFMAGVIFARSIDYLKIEKLLAEVDSANEEYRNRKNAPSRIESLEKALWVAKETIKWYNPDNRQISIIEEILKNRD